MFKGKKVKLTKIGSVRFHNNHPNGINTGYIAQGYCPFGPRIGENLLIGNMDGLQTSPVQSIKVIDEQSATIWTLNSIYKLEIIK